VVERNAVRVPVRLEAVEKSVGLRRQRLAVHPRRECGVAVELVEVDRAADREIVVPGEADGGPLFDDGTALVRTRPVPHDVPEAPELVRRVGVDRLENRLERVEIRKRERLRIF